MIEFILIWSMIAFVIFMITFIEEISINPRFNLNKFKFTRLGYMTMFLITMPIAVVFAFGSFIYLLWIKLMIRG